MTQNDLIVVPICNICITTPKPHRKLGYPNITDLSLGAMVKRKRLDLGWSQERTAKQMKLDLASYQRLEWNKHKPRTKKILKAKEFLKYIPNQS